MNKVVAAALIVLVAACDPGSPIAIDDPPLADRLEQRRAEAAAVFDTADEPPDELALDGDEAAAISFRDPFQAEITNSPLGVRLRTGPGSGYDDFLVIPDNALIATTGNVTGEWVQVRYGDFEGWIASRVLRPVQSNTGDTIPVVEGEAGRRIEYVVAGAEVGVNIRTEPDAASELVSGAPVGSRVIGTGMTSDEWVEVEFAGVTGWAFGGYLRPAAEE